MADTILPNFTVNIIRFWSQVALTADDSRCWEWIGSNTGRGNYGQFHAHKKTWRAHRYAWLIVYGRLPVGMLCHKCDNPRCVNPKHLYEGNAQTNIRDMVRRDRFRLGSPDRNLPHQRLVVAQVLKIRERFDSGSISKRALAREYKVDPATIRRIITRRNWGYI